MRNLGKRNLGMRTFGIGSSAYNLVDRALVVAEDKATKYVVNNVKEHFGKDYNLSAQDGSVSTFVGKFLKKYDPNYSKRVVEGNSKTSLSYQDGTYLIKLEEATFAYILTGRYNMDYETRLLTNTGSLNDMYLYVFGRKSYKYIKMINKLLADSKVNGLGIYNVDKSRNNYNGGNMETLSVTFQNMQERDIDTMYFSNGEVDSVCKHIDKFLNDEDFYKSRQLLYKTGILFKGEPGTGKSSFVRAIATKYRRSIININVPNIKDIDLAQLTQSINIDDVRYLILLEDIDTLFLNRQDEAGTTIDNSMVLNKLLQFLDSNTSPNNVIFIATTNHPESLDEAMLRRFDLKIDIAPLNRIDAKAYLKSFEIPDNLSEYILDNIENANDEDRKGKYNQKTLQDYAISNKQNKSIEEVRNIYKLEDGGDIEEVLDKKEDLNGSFMRLKNDEACRIAKEPVITRPEPNRILVKPDGTKIDMFTGEEVVDKSSEKENSAEENKEEELDELF